MAFNESSEIFIFLVRQHCMVVDGGVNKGFLNGLCFLVIMAYS